jgi:hypothetical protein
MHQLMIPIPVAMQQQNQETPRSSERSKGPPMSPGISSTRFSEGTLTFTGTRSSKTSQCRKVDQYHKRKFDRLQPDRIHYPNDNHGDKNNVRRSSSAGARLSGQIFDEDSNVLLASGQDARSDAQVELAKYARSQLEASSEAFQEPIQFDEPAMVAATSTNELTTKAKSKLQKRYELAALVHMILVEAIEHMDAPEPVKKWAGNTCRELAQEGIVTARPAEDNLELGLEKKKFYLSALNFLLVQGKESLNGWKMHTFVFQIGALCKLCNPKFDMVPQDRRTSSES